MNLGATISLDTRRFQEGVAAARAGTEGLRGILGKVAGTVANPFIAVTASLGGMAGAVALVKRSLDLSAELEQNQTAFSVMLGSMDKAKALMQDIATTASATPFEIPELASSVRQLLAFQVPAAEVIDTVKMLGDISSATRKPMGELAMIFGQARAQGRLMGQDLLQLANAGIPIYEELATHLGKTTAEIRDMTEKGQIGFNDMLDVFQKLTSEGGLFFGMMGQQSRTFSGLMSTLRDSIGQLLTAFGTPIMTALKPIIANMTSELDKLRPQIEAIGRRAGDALTVVFNAFKTGQLTELVSLSLKVAFMDATNTLVGALRAAGEATKTIFSAIFSPDTLKALSLQFEVIGTRIQAVLKGAAADFAEMFGRKQMAADLRGQEQTLTAAADVGQAGVNAAFSRIPGQLGAALAVAWEQIKAFQPADLFKDLPEARKKLEALKESLRQVGEAAAEGTPDARGPLSGVENPAGADGTRSRGLADIARPNVDNFARVGMFVGAGPAAQSAQRTASATEATAKAVQKLVLLWGTGPTPTAVKWA
jgi:tape measure domain-containing protein